MSITDDGKNKGGRPKEDVVEKLEALPTGLAQVERLAGLGLTDKEIGRALGKCEQTINNWKKDERFLVALKKGKEEADRRVTKSLFKRACGYRYTEKTYEKQTLTKAVVKQFAPDTTACIFWLKNRRPEDWRDKREMEHSGGFAVTLNKTIVKSTPESGAEAKGDSC